MLYEMLTGQSAFAGPDLTTTLARVLERDANMRLLPANVELPVHRALGLCLEKDPNERIADIRDVRLALAGRFETVPRVDDPRARRRAAQRRALAPAIGLLAGAALAAVALLRQPAPPASADEPIRFAIEAPAGSAFALAAMSPFPAVSPDGRRLAFVAPHESRGAVWVQTLGTLEARPLAGTEGGGLPFWSPDGESIGFMADGRVKRIAANGSGAPLDIAAIPGGRSLGGAWSQDDTIMFQGSGGLYGAPADGGDPAPLTRIDASRAEQSHRFPVMLPDGRRFLYLVVSTDEAIQGLYLGSLDDPDLKQRIVETDTNGAFVEDGDGRTWLL